MNYIMQFLRSLAISYAAGVVAEKFLDLQRSRELDPIIPYVFEEVCAHRDTIRTLHLEALQARDDGDWVRSGALIARANGMHEVLRDLEDRLADLIDQSPIGMSFVDISDLVAHGEL